MKKQGAKFLKALSERSDIAVALLLVLVIFMMILPIPTVIVDIFIAANISGAVIILMLGVYIQSPLEFSSFPSVLLLTTLFRLALSITTTRLILIDGEAGDIIQTFGEFVVGGNLIVGLVIFLIITLVQFIVITKGSERIAEVSARFTLDAMPGKQMSVDSDLRAGIISSDMARKKRSNIEKESQLFGSMDGAMKFVKGDAIAGILITFINLIGGISIGVLQQGMSFSEATAIFSVLTIGDGLVAQIPALIIAISSGIVVTRISGDEPTNLGEDIANQVTAQPLALLVAGGLLFAFAIIPGFPTLVVGGMAIVFVLAGMRLIKRAKMTAGTSLAQEIPSLNRAGHVSIEIRPDGRPVSFSHLPVIVKLAENLRLELTTDALKVEIDKVRALIENDFGIPFPGVELTFDDFLEDDQFHIQINGITQWQGFLKEGESAAVSNHLKQQNILASAVSVAAEPTDLSIITAQETSNFVPEYFLGQAISHTLLTNAKEFIGIQETHFLLQQYEYSLGELIKETLRVTPTPKLATILRMLVSERVPISDIRTILEVIALNGEAVQDPPELAALVRIELKKAICAPFIDRNQQINVILIEPAREEVLMSSLRQTPQGISLVLEPEMETSFLHNIRTLLKVKDGIILVTSPGTRLGLASYLANKKIVITVLSDSELLNDVPLNIIGKV